MIKITRREALKLGLVVGGSTVLPLGLASRVFSATTPITQRGQMFQAPVRIPTVLQPKSKDATTDYYEITQKKAKVGIFAGAQTEIWGYNGQFPGPTIKARVGRNTVIRQINQLPEAVAVHLHGMPSLPEYDGYPEDLIQPGTSRDYVYPNTRAGTFWYHDHALMKTRPHVYNGLAGFYILQDDLETRLNLPTGAYDVPLAIRDCQLNENNALEKFEFCDTILVNGVPWPYMRVENRKYRFRFLNASVTRAYGLALSSGEPLTVIGSDSGLIAAPVQVPDMLIAPGERYEVVIDFSQYPVGTQVVLKNLYGEDESSPLGQIMRFDVIQRKAQDTSVVPSQLRPAQMLSESAAVRTRNISYDLIPNSADEFNPTWTINRRGWDRNFFIAKPKLGDVEIWSFTNDASNTFAYHVAHLHMVDFRILDRKKNGNKTPPRAYEKGRKDSFFLEVGETVRILVQFTPNKGKYIMHCHLLGHEDMDMMTQFEVV